MHFDTPGNRYFLSLSTNDARYFLDWLFQCYTMHPMLNGNKLTPCLIKAEQAIMSEALVA